MAAQRHPADHGHDMFMGNFAPPPPGFAPPVPTGPPNPADAGTFPNTSYRLRQLHQAVAKMHRRGH